MILVRKMLDYVFTKRELKILDDILPTSTRPQIKKKADPALATDDGEKGHLNNVSWTCLMLIYVVFI